MNQTKIITYKLLLLFGICLNMDYGNCQRSIFVVDGYKNTTGNLKDNFRIDSLNVSLKNSTFSITCIVQLDKEERTNCYVPSGIYQFSCWINNKESIVVQEVIVRNDMITFISVLFEPEQDLKFFARRKRNKTYANKFIRKSLTP